MRAILLAGLLMGAPFAALAASGHSGPIHNAVCWGGATDDLNSPEISCTALTHELFEKLRGATEEAVQKAMGVPGRAIPNGLHFLSNYKRGDLGKSGVLNVNFEDGRVSRVQALIDRPDGALPPLQYIWSAGGSSCSDIGGGLPKCPEFP